jgi:hypothetical protein
MAMGAPKDGTKAYLDQIMTKMMTKSPFFSEPLYVPLLAWLPYCKNFDPLLATYFNEHQMRSANHASSNRWRKKY